MKNNMNSIIKRIKKRRKELGFSYQDLADKTKMSKSTLQRYETGAIKNIPLDKLEVLASALEISPAYLLGIEEEEENANNKNTSIEKMSELQTLTADEKELISTYRKLDEEAKKFIKYAIESELED